MAISDSPISATFGKPFKFQVAAFRLRLAELKATTGWDKEVWQAEHDRAFMVAGAIRADILADLAAAVDKAISQGTTLETFRKDFRKIVAEKGWKISPAGQGTKGGEAWRTKVIYKTNLSTSYAAGRFAQLTQAGYPFLVYRHGASIEPRLQHLAWDGLVLPADHLFWKSHCPPNGWGCTCYITGARSKESARRVGGKPEKELPAGWQMADSKTGAPVGIDRGWAYAPGASVAQTVASLVPKLEALPEAPSIDLIQSWLKMDAFADWMAAPVGNWPLARIPAADADRLKSEVKVALLSQQTAAKQEREHPELLGLDYLMAQEVIDRAKDRIQDTASTMIYVYQPTDGNGYVLVVKVTVSGKGLFVSSFRRLSADEATRDRTLRRLLSKEGR
jgi:hypothetical protein